MVLSAPDFFTPPPPTGRRRSIAGGLLLALCLCLCATSLAAQWQEYQAGYAVYRNGKLIGQMDYTLSQQAEGRWSLTRVGHGTRGLARLLGAKDNESVEGWLEAGRFRPEHFSHHSRIAGVDKIWQTAFDWQNRSVTITRGKDVRVLNFATDVFDPLSFSFEIQRRLREQEQDLLFYLVDDDEIKQWHYRQLPRQEVGTALGCFSAVPVERMHPQSNRYTRSWLAPALDFLTVRMERGKSNGEHIELRITSLVFADATETPTTDCAAHAGSP